MIMDNKISNVCWTTYGFVTFDFVDPEICKNRFKKNT
jgi:hypothetical protein